MTTHLQLIDIIIKISSVYKGVWRSRGAITECQQITRTLKNVGTLMKMAQKTARLEELNKGKFDAFHFLGFVHANARDRLVKRQNF